MGQNLYYEEYVLYILRCNHLGHANTLLVKDKACCVIFLGEKRATLLSFKGGEWGQRLHWCYSVEKSGGRGFIESHPGHYSG